MNTIVEVLRQAAERFTLSEAEGLRTTGNGSLIIPDFDEDSLSNPYPLGIQPGTYRLEEVARAMQFLADMLEE